MEFPQASNEGEEENMKTVNTPAEEFKAWQDGTERWCVDAADYHAVKQRARAEAIKECAEVCNDKSSRGMEYRAAILALQKKPT